MTQPAAVIDDARLVRRLHDRLTFGASAYTLDQSIADGPEATASVLLTPPTRTRPAVRAPELDFPTPPGAGATLRERRVFTHALQVQNRALFAWWLQCVTVSGQQSTEKLTWYWHDHYATSQTKVRSPLLMLMQHQTLRRHAWSANRLAAAMVIDPAMLVWLDGNRSDKKAPNENLGRELMELFLLGVGSYTEDDVQAAARALTGWTTSRATGKVVFRAELHDPGPQTVLGRTAKFTATSLVNHLVSQPASPRHVIGRVWRRVVGTDAPDDATMNTLLEAYGVRGDMSALLSAMVASATFRSTDAALVRPPVDWLVALLRMLEVNVATLEQTQLTALSDGLARLGQVPFAPPNVSGWPHGKSWLTTASAMARTSVAQTVVGLPSEVVTSLRSPADPDELARLLGVPAWTQRTTTALSTVSHDPRAALVVAACAPEFVVSA